MAVELPARAGQSRRVQVAPGRRARPGFCLRRLRVRARRPAPRSARFQSGSSWGPSPGRGSASWRPFAASRPPPLVLDAHRDDDQVVFDVSDNCGGLLAGRAEQGRVDVLQESVPGRGRSAKISSSVEDHRAATPADRRPPRRYSASRGALPHVSLDWTASPRPPSESRRRWRVPDRRSSRSLCGHRPCVSCSTQAARILRSTARGAAWTVRKATSYRSRQGKAFHRRPSRNDRSASWPPP